MTGFEPSPILNFKSVAQHPTTTPAIAAAGPLQNFAVYMRNILTDTVPDHDPDARPARRGVQLPYPNKCNYMLTSGTRGETLSPNECHSTPPSVIRGPLQVCLCTNSLGIEYDFSTASSRSAEQARRGAVPPSSLFRKITKEYILP